MVTVPFFRATGGSVAAASASASFPTAVPFSSISSVFSRKAPPFRFFGTADAASSFTSKSSSLYSSSFHSSSSAFSVTRALSSTLKWSLCGLKPAALLGQVRYATHMSEGRANGAKNGPGKRLGPKKGDGEYVVPGNILFRQRGTLWFPGENCFMGRDQTIHAKTAGYVRYYRDPARHPTRSFIGVVLERDGRLPRPQTDPRPRRLGLIALESRQQKDLASQQPQHATLKIDGLVATPKPRHRRDYVARDPNYLIGRLKNSPHSLPLPERKSKAQSIGRLTMGPKKKSAKGKSAGRGKK